MNEQGHLALNERLETIDARVRAGEQPRIEIASLAAETFIKVTQDGARRWHQHQLESVISSLNWHRNLQSANPGTVTGLRLALTAVGLLALPTDSVIETARGAADAATVAGMLKYLRDLS